MSTRSATIIRQTTYWGEQAETEELLRFYRHYDGYPEGHGLDMARAMRKADQSGIAVDYWASTLLGYICDGSMPIEIEPHSCEHGDIEYLYVVEGIVDHRWGRKRDNTMPVTISVYSVGWDDSYSSILKREPMFSGTAYEYIEKFGKEQQ